MESTAAATPSQAPRPRPCRDGCCKGHKWPLPASATPVPVPPAPSTFHSFPVWVPVSTWAWGRGNPGRTPLPHQSPRWPAPRAAPPYPASWSGEFHTSASLLHPGSPCASNPAAGAAARKDPSGGPRSTGRLWGYSHAPGSGSKEPLTPNAATQAGPTPVRLAAPPPPCPDGTRHLAPRSLHPGPRGPARLAPSSERTSLGFPSSVDAEQHGKVATPQARRCAQHCRQLPSSRILGSVRRSAVCLSPAAATAYRLHHRRRHRHRQRHHRRRALRPRSSPAHGRSSRPAPAHSAPGEAPAHWGAAGAWLHLRKGPAPRA